MVDEETGGVLAVIERIRNIRRQCGGPWWLSAMHAASYHLDRRVHYSYERRSIKNREARARVAGQASRDGRRLAHRS